MYRIIVAALLCLSVQSCRVYGFTDDYKKLSDAEKSMIVPLKTFVNTDQSKIYKVNGLQLREEIQKHPKSLVYFFTNGCTFEYCRPVSVYQDFAEENGYKLFLVMEGFGKLEKTTVQRSDIFTAPLFAMDSDFYGKSYSGTYSKYFQNDLRGQQRNTKNEWQGSLYFFEHGKLSKILRDLP